LAASANGAANEGCSASLAETDDTVPGNGAYRASEDLVYDRWGSMDDRGQRLWAVCPEEPDPRTLNGHMI
jgi:hypothetical protein